MSWQLGDGFFPKFINGKPVGGFQKLFRAVANGDYEKIVSESKVFYKDRFGKWHFDDGRHKFRLKNYLNYGSSVKLIQKKK